MTISRERLQELVTEKAGTGQRIRGEMYSPGYIERVEFGEVIGEYALEYENGSVQYIHNKGDYSLCARWCACCSFRP